MQGDENQHTAGKRNILRGSSRAGSATRRAFLRAVENYVARYGRDVQRNNAGKVKQDADICNTLR